MSELLGIPLLVGLGGLAPPNGPLFLTTPFALWTLQIWSNCQVCMSMFSVDIDLWESIVVHKIRKTWQLLCSASELESCPQLGPETRVKARPEYLSPFQRIETKPTSGKSRQSSSATLGSISWKYRPQERWNTHSISSTCPSLPILTGLPSFQGLYRCWTFWKLRSPLQIQSRWNTPPRALADKPGGRSQDTWIVKGEAMWNLYSTQIWRKKLWSNSRRLKILPHVWSHQEIFEFQGYFQRRPLPWAHPSCFLLRAEPHHRTFPIPDCNGRRWLKRDLFPFYTFTE